MTFYEVLQAIQHTQCKVAEQLIQLLDKPEDRGPAFERMMREAIDRTYVLGEIIDGLPVELAEKEI